MSAIPSWALPPPRSYSGAPCLVELVGPAGAGKSTILSTLLANGARYGGGLTIWGQPRRHLLRAALELAPVAAAAVGARRPLRRRELAQMIRLTALRRVADAARRAAQSDESAERLLLMDEGPLFGLAWLDVLFERRDPIFTRWRHRALREWGRRLAAVVRLDASDPVLAWRIRTREQAHPVKQRSEAEIARFTARFRRAFDRVFADLDDAAPVTVVHLRTDEALAPQAVARVHRALEEAARGR